MKPALIRNGKRAHVKEFRSICEEMLGDAVNVIALNNNHMSFVADSQRFRFCIWSDLKPSGPISSHLEPFAAIRSHLEPFWSCLGLSGTTWAWLEPS